MRIKVKREVWMRTDLLLVISYFSFFDTLPPSLLESFVKLQDAINLSTWGHRVTAPEWSHWSVLGCGRGCSLGSALPWRRSVLEARESSWSPPTAALHYGWPVAASPGRRKEEETTTSQFNGSSFNMLQNSGFQMTGRWRSSSWTPEHPDKQNFITWVRGNVWNWSAEMGTG